MKGWVIIWLIYSIKVPSQILFFKTLWSTSTENSGFMHLLFIKCTLSAKNACSVLYTLAPAISALSFHCLKCSCYIIVFGCIWLHTLLKIKMIGGGSIVYGVLWHFRRQLLVCWSFNSMLSSDDNLSHNSSCLSSQQQHNIIILLALKTKLLHCPCFVMVLLLK